MTDSNQHVEDKRSNSLENNINHGAEQAVDCFICVLYSETQSLTVRSIYLT